MIVLLRIAAIVLAPPNTPPPEALPPWEGEMMSPPSANPSAPSPPVALFAEKVLPLIDSEPASAATAPPLAAPPFGGSRR